MIITLSQEIIKSLKTLDPGFLSQIYNFTESLKKIDRDKKGKFDNKTHPLAKFVGTIDNEEAQSLRLFIDKEFAQIEANK